jgi:hypothetical protein
VLPAALCLSLLLLPLLLLLPPMLLPLLLSLLLLLTLATDSLPPIVREGLLGTDGRSRIFMFAAVHNTMPCCTARRFVGTRAVRSGSAAIQATHWWDLTPMQPLHTTLTCMRVAVHVPKSEDHLGKRLRDEVAHLRQKTFAPSCHGGFAGSLQVLKQCR